MIVSQFFSNQEKSRQARKTTTRAETEAGEYSRPPKIAQNERTAKRLSRRGGGSLK
jgi:hypothetical protein